MGNGEQSVGAELRRSVRVSSRSGRVEVVAEERPDVVAEKAGEPLGVDPDGDGISISSRRSSLLVRVPEGTDVVVGTVSGSVSITGRFGRVAVNSISGRIEIDHAASVDARGVSSRVKVGECEGEARCDVVSGNAEVGSAGSVRLSTASGHITARSVRGKVRVKTVSGKIRVGVSTSPVDVKAECVSGRIQVRLPRGTRPETSLSAKHGKVHSKVSEGPDGTVSARAVSGSILIDEAPG
jgi:DUF4097 and DUF4098 domain-containing protein YvlB